MENCIVSISFETVGLNIMASFYFFSELSSTYKEALEKLFFFNEYQEDYYDKIVNVVNRFGEPKIVTRDQSVYIQIGDYSRIQNIFAAIGPKLIGIIVFIEDILKNINILHIAVHKDYNFNGKYGNEMLAVQLVNEVLGYAKKIQGIERVIIGYINKKIDIK